MIKKYSRTILLLISAGLIISLVSCNPAKKYEKDEKQAIDNYLNSNPDLNFELKPSGMYYLDVVVGTGAAPGTHDTCYVQYTGMYLDGTTFNSNVGQPDLIFPANEGFLIPGFDEGITYMKAGGKAKFLLPSNLAYGTQGYYTIPGYTPLLYDVELKQVKRSSGK